MRMSEHDSAKNPPAETENPRSLSDDERRRMVAEAAYFRALARGFQGGSAEEDWHAATREVERAHPPTSGDRQHELAAYRALRARVAELLGEAGGMVDAPTIAGALSRATRDVRSAGHDAGDVVSRAAQAVKVELAHAVDAVESALESASLRTPEIFGAWRGRGESFLAQAAAAVRSWLHEIGVCSAAHRAGEMTFAGTLQCRKCGARTTLPAAGHVTPCTQCGHGEFLRLQR
jgi:hypothetical protein